MYIDDINGRRARFYYLIGYYEGAGAYDGNINVFERLYDLSASYGRVHADEVYFILENDELNDTDKIEAIMCYFKGVLGL